MPLMYIIANMGICERQKIEIISQPFHDSSTSQERYLVAHLLETPQGFRPTHYGPELTLAQYIVLHDIAGKVDIYSPNSYQNVLRLLESNHFKSEAIAHSQDF